MRNVLDTVVEKIPTHILHSTTWKIMEEPDRSQITIYYGECAHKAGRPQTHTQNI
jgi:hypothetical protein